jgi:hypothetical protein
VKVSQNAQERTNGHSPLVPFQAWLKGIGVSRTTGWRWRKAGFIHTVCIMGRHYLLQKEIELFTRRAAAGEFEGDAFVGYGNMPRHLAEARGLVTSKIL